MKKLIAAGLIAATLGGTAMAATSCVYPLPGGRFVIGVLFNGVCRMNTR